MSAELKIIALAQAIGADIKAARLERGTLSGLSTTAKTNLVAAINEIYGLVGSAGATINDSAGNGATTVVWSADKVYGSIEAAKTAVINSLTNGAAAAFDTLAELQAALGNDASFAATIATQMGNRIRYDAVQTLTAPQQAQACANIGVGNPERDFTADYITAKT